MIFTLCRCGFLNFLLPHRASNPKRLCAIPTTKISLSTTTTTTHTKSNAILTVTVTITVTVATSSRNRKKRTKRKQLNNSIEEIFKISTIAKATLVNKILILIQNQIQILLVLQLIDAVVLCTPTARKNDINLTPPKQLTLLTLPLQLQFLAALVYLLLVTTNFKSELHHMLCDLTIQRHTVAITYDLSETPAKKGAPPIPQKRSKSFELCMNSKRRTISHRTSSNRHRKLQPFRYT